MSHPYHLRSTNVVHEGNSGAEAAQSHVEQSASRHSDTDLNSEDSLLIDETAASGSQARSGLVEEITATTSLPSHTTGHITQDTETTPPPHQPVLPLAAPAAAPAAATTQFPSIK